jgi:hypothetical protein
METVPVSWVYGCNAAQVLDHSIKISRIVYCVGPVGCCKNSREEKDS